MTRLECKQLCVLRLGDIVGYAKPQKVKPGINWGQTAPITNTLHAHTYMCAQCGIVLPQGQAENNTI